MTLSQISDLSQLVGALAVVFSLLYLSRQIRQNTHAVRMANATTLQTEFRGLARTLYADTNTAAIVLAGMKGEPVGSPAGQLAAHAWFFDLLKMAELGHYHFRNGDLDPQLWDASLRFYRSWFDSPGVRAYWEVRRSVFMPEFQQAMDEWLRMDMDLVRPDHLAERISPAKRQG
ncbi:MAG: hypothetical protein Q8P50_04100 [Bacillota bacterium]|nr:hypothetical protein [Bacillota bacterium]